MDRRRMMLWAMLGLSTMLTAYTIWPRTRAGAPATAATGAASPPAAAATAPAAAPGPVAPSLAAAAFEGWRSRLEPAPRDPFFTAAELEAMARGPTPAPVEMPAPAPPLEPPPPLPAYTLKLVLGTGSGMRALIGNQIVRVGDVLGNERVVEILPNAVVLEHEGERRLVQLAGKPVALDGIHLERTR